MTTKEMADDTFGLCPSCHKTDGHLNVGRNHWFVCHQHHVRWHAGENLFSSWRRETEAIWERSWQRISHYSEIEPVFHDRTHDHEAKRTLERER